MRILEVALQGANTASVRFDPSIRGAIHSLGGVAVHSTRCGLLLPLYSMHCVSDCWKKLFELKDARR